jgi:hypothetical protein
MSKQFIFLPNSMYIKCSNVTRTECPITMYKVSKMKILGILGHWLNMAHIGKNLQILVS